MARAFADIEQEIRALGRNDQVRFAEMAREHYAVMEVACKDE